jgi:hypothetical protein
MSAAAQGAVLVPISPPTQVPPTLVPPTQVPPTQVPPTLVPPTEVPPTQVPPTETPTQVPPTGIPTEVPPTEVPPTQVPPTETPVYTPYMSLSFAPMETPPEGIGSWCSFSVTIAGAAPNQTIQITIDRHIDGQIHSYVDSVVIGPDGTGSIGPGPRDPYRGDLEWLLDRPSIGGLLSPNRDTSPTHRDTVADGDSGSTYGDASSTDRNSVPNADPIPAHPDTRS